MKNTSKWLTILGRITGRLTLGLLSVAVSIAPAAASAPPNVLLILADDLGIEHLEMFDVGDAAQFISTPNISALAYGGLRFDHAWSNPLCSPTRVTIQTGRYAFRTGVGSNTINPNGAVHRGMQLDELTLPELLTGVGYQTGAFGKWHMGSDPSLGGHLAPNLAGYSHFEGALGPDNIGPEGLPPDLYFNYTKTVDGVTEQVVNGYATRDTVDAAISWINTRTEGPWFAYVAQLAPHDPFHWPPDDMHSQDTGQQGDLPRYRAMVEALDMQIGRPLDSIDRTNTLIVFASDNGSSREVALPPFRPNNAKGTLFEGGIRVPLIISGDMVGPGIVTGLVNLTDLYATVAEVAGAQIPATVVHDSVSLVPYFSNPGLASLRAHAYSEIFTPNRVGWPLSTGIQVARNSRYKFGRNLSGAQAMADLVADPWETVNLLATDLDEDQQNAYDELRGYVAELIPACTLARVGQSCGTNQDCCSGRCRGWLTNRT